MGTVWQGRVDRILDAALAEFGEGCTYKPKIGDQFPISGIFTSAHQELDPSSGAVVSSNQPILGIKLSAFATPPVQDDEVIVRGDTYRVADKQDDGEGGATLFLHKK